jgi:hypothetical protein
MIKRLIVLLSILGIVSGNFATENSSKPGNYLDGYIVDGQVYVLKLNDSNTGKVFLSFFDGFNYRLLISSKTTQKYQIKLFDIEKKILYSTTCDDYTKFIDLRFQSNAACYAEIAAEGNSSSNIFSISIGFKEIITTKQ